MKISTRQKLLSEADLELITINRLIVEQRLLLESKIIQNLLNSAFVQATLNNIKKYKIVAGMPTTFWKETQYLLGSDIIKNKKLNVDEESLRKLLKIIDDILKEFKNSIEFQDLIAKLNKIQLQMASLRIQSPEFYSRDLWKKSVYEFNQIVDKELFPLIDSILKKEQYKYFSALIISSFKDASPTELKQIESNYLNIIKSRASDYVKKSATYHLTPGEKIYLEKPDFPPGKTIPEPNKKWIT